MPKYDYLIKSNRHGNGGYSAFMEKIINRMIISKIANSNFFTISTILTFHKHPSFHRLGIAACICKGGHNRRWINPPLRKSCLIGLLRQNYYTPKLYIFQYLLVKMHPLFCTLWRKRCVAAFEAMHFSCVASAAHFLIKGVRKQKKRLLLEPLFNIIKLNLVQIWNKARTGSDFKVLAALINAD